MNLVLPPRVTGEALNKALQGAAGIVGSEWVLTTDKAREDYADAYAPGDAQAYAPSAVICPSSVEQVQAIVRVANEYKVPLWPISRGKNLGYGGSAPRVAGTVILDLGRMNRILEVDEQLAYCVLEPGVGFSDLFAHLQQHKSRLWMSTPAHSLGSVVGNALERGFGTSPYGEHAANVCGMEVVLPDGTLIRTGMGAMTGANSWSHYKYGFGPSWDQMFMQSSFGVVTKLGLWLMPEPESTLHMAIGLPAETDIHWVVDALYRLRTRGVIQGRPAIGSPLRLAAAISQRSQWDNTGEPLSDALIQQIADKYKIGRWLVEVRLSGLDEVNEIHARAVREAFAQHTQAEFRTAKWKRGQPIEHSGAGVPSSAALRNVEWYGGVGGHLDFSPICPPTGAHAAELYALTRSLFRTHGFDYVGGFTFGERHLYQIAPILYDRTNDRMTQRARDLYSELVTRAAQKGYGLYRAHLNFMDHVARSYDFNSRALHRLNERLKNVMDPNGILAPGKQGIWPATGEM